jgi:hypothetical protein
MLGAAKSKKCKCTIPHVQLRFRSPGSGCHRGSDGRNGGLHLPPPTCRARAAPVPLAQVMHVTTALSKESGRLGYPGGQLVVSIDLHLLPILPR